MNKYALGKQKTLAELCVKKDDYIQELERAVMVLSGSYSDWPLNVSDGDELLINKLINDIEST